MNHELNEVIQIVRYASMVEVSYVSPRQPRDRASSLHARSTIYIAMAAENYNISSEQEVYYRMPCPR